MEEHGINSATLIVQSAKSRDSITWSQDSTITPSIFHEFTQAVQEKCPLIHEVIETLVISNQQERNVHKKFLLWGRFG